MYCPNCKKMYPEGSTFCTICGAPLEKAPQKKKGSFFKGLLCGLLIMAILGGSVLTVLYFTGRSPAHRGYDSPEKAAEAYFEACKTGDVEKILNTFAAEEVSAHSDLEAYCKQFRMYTRWGLQALPNTGDCLRELNTEHMKNLIAGALSDIYLRPLRQKTDASSLELKEGEPFECAGDVLEALRREDFEEQLSRMELLEILPAEELTEIHPNLGMGMEMEQEKNGSWLSCDDTTEVLLRFKFDGETCCQNLTLICFDGKWYALNLGGLISNLLELPYDMHGFCTEEEYEAALEARQ